MNTQLSIKNFRVFDENGVRIDIKPLTILTGCNSSGKSSIVKAAFLLNSFMKQVNEAIENGDEIELSKYKIDFTGYPNNLLGRFDKVIPFGSSSQKMSLGYTIHSYMLSKDVDVELVFTADKNDDLNNAYLTSISMSTDEGVFYSSDKENGNVYNLNIIKDSLLIFAPIDFLISQFCINYSCPIGEEFLMSEEEYNNEQDCLISQLRALGKDRVMEVVRYNRFKKDKKEKDYTKEQVSILEWTEKKDSFFNIPVLEYLRTIGKDVFKDVIEKELISDGDNNAYLVSCSAVLAASKRVVKDFLISEFDSFDKYFIDFEHKYFANVVISSDKNTPSLSSICLKQNFTRSYPKSGWSHGVLLWDDENNSQKRNVEKEETPQQEIKEWEEKPLTFDKLYEVVMLWNEKYSTGKSDYYKGGACEVKLPNGDEIVAPSDFHHHAFDMLASFANKLIHEVIANTGFENMSYVSSSRASVKKLYALDDKNDFTELLQRYFEAKRQFKERKKYLKPDYVVNSFMNHWVQQYGIGDSMSFQLDEEGLGVKIYLHKSADDKGHLLADEGYGITQLISILLQIETAILSAQEEKANKESVDGLSCFDNYDEVEYHFEENTIAIEEPEIHLHPSYQSKLAEMFAEAYSKYNIHFIIETHSEYLIRKLQTLAAKKDINADDISIQYVYSPLIEQRPLYAPQVKQINVKGDGRLTDSFGSGFFDEADNAAMELLTLKEHNL